MINVRSVIYKMIAFVFVKAKFLFFFLKGLERISLIGDSSGVFCFSSLVRNHKLRKLQNSIDKKMNNQFINATHIYNS